MKKCLGQSCPLFGRGPARTLGKYIASYREKSAQKPEEHMQGLYAWRPLRLMIAARRFRMTNTELKLKRERMMEAFKAGKSALEEFDRGSTELDERLG